jgi:predicted dithiol-disulfide oxidoreductase (DUF899 family)
VRNGSPPGGNCSPRRRNLPDARGLDMLNGAYHWLDLMLKERDETGPQKMAWVGLHDEYQR